MALERAVAGDPPECLFALDPDHLLIEWRFIALALSLLRLSSSESTY